MENLEANKELAKVLDLLDFKRHYLKGLSRSEFYRIELATLDRTVKCSPAWQFIYDITRYNYRARNIQSEEFSTVDTSEMSLREKRKLKQEQTYNALHPMDIVVAVFLCCDPVTKQDLAMHLLGCKLAIPFCIQTIPFDNPNVYLWPLQSLLGHVWHDDGFIEKPLADEAMPCVSFIRVGDNEPLSKSYLINCVIWGTEKVHPMFFHRDSDGSKRTRSDIVEGLIEVGWALPGHSDDRFDCPRLFMNLRGDAAFHIKQVQIIGHISSVTVLLCTTNNLKKSDIVIRELLERDSRVLLLIIDQCADETTVEDFINKVSYQSDTRIDAVMKGTNTLPGIVRTLLRTIKKLEKGKRKIVHLSDVNACQCQVDNVVYPYTTVSKHAKAIIKALQSTKEVERKRVSFPLQEEYWKEFSKLDRKMSDIKRHEKNIGSRQNEISLVQKDMNKHRRDLMKHIQSKNISEPVRMFLKQLSKKDNLYKRIFLRTLKLELDNFSRVQLQPFYKKYKVLVSQANSATASERDNFYKEMSQLDNTKQTQSIGLEHFIREMGQIYEACDPLKPHPMGNIFHNELPKYAVFILQEGYPLEILDGDVNAVPQIWVNSVVDQMHVLTNEKTAREHSNNVHVVSVLGIQSSGKSTFLNTMFGLQFAVSAGRCTKGAFIQLIQLAPKVYEYFNAQYIMLIDTEGLRSSELNSAESIKHDNEFSTLVIGLSDITLINLMGENATYLRDNLPIVVHAFLRMNLVGLCPRCTIVHHNVDKHNKDKLLNEGRKLEDILNDLTKKACEIEKVPSRSFNDMIEFSIEENTDYIPALFDGELPMAPVSTGYSSEVQSVKIKLFQILHKNKPYLTGFKPFSKRLDQLWNAIKTDYFVFEFRSTYETEMRLQLDSVKFKIKKDYLIKLKEIIERNVQIATKKKSKRVTENLQKEIKGIQKKCLKEFDDFLATSCVVSERYETWTSCMKKTLELEMQTDQTMSIEQMQLQEQCNPIVSNHSFEYFIELFDKEFQNASTRNDAFERAWIIWVENVNTELPLQITTHTLKALESICHGHEYLLKDKDIRSYTLQDFCPTSERYTNKELPWRSDLQMTPNTVVTNIIDKTFSCAKGEYQRALNNIKQRKIKYNHTYPELILLLVEKEINESLENLDKETLVRIQFKYDLLMHAAGSVINDFKTMLMDLSKIKNELEEVVRRKTKSLTENFDDVVFRILTMALDFSFSSHACYLVSQHLSSSSNNIESKQALLGRCIYSIVEKDDDEMLKYYIRSPKEGTLQYLEAIITEVVKHSDFKPCLRSYVNQQYEKIAASIYANETQYVEFGKLLSDILNGDIVDPNEAAVIECAKTSEGKRNVNISALRETLEKRKTHVMQTETDRLHSIISEKNNGIIKYCTDNLFKSIIGCTATCPFCKEICIYSKNHPDKHQCFVHRPDGVGGGYWLKTNHLCCETCTEHYQCNTRFRFKGEWVPFKDYEKCFKDWDIVSLQETEPHKVWKWILVKKFRLLATIPGIELPENIPKEWEEITKAEALTCLRDKFGIYPSE